MNSSTGKNFEAVYVLMQYDAYGQQCLVRWMCNRPNCQYVHNINPNAKGKPIFSTLYCGTTLTLDCNVNVFFIIHNAFCLRICGASSSVTTADFQPSDRAISHVRIRAMCISNNVFTASWTYLRNPPELLVKH